MSNDIVSTEWLADHLGSPDIAIIDASWHLPTAQRDAKKEFLEAHIPGAQFFDIDELSETASSLPHMLPSPEKFSSRMRRMGIGDGKRVIAYDSVGLFSAARAWWMFKVFGHDDVTVLDGGLKKWLAEGRATADGPALKAQERHFTARFKGSMVKDMKEVAAALKSGAGQIADARSGTRFRGEEVEPRPGVRAGHMPGARNVHYASLLNPDGTLKSPDAIAAAFTSAGVDLARPVITSCGSGVTAAILTLGLTLAGARDHALYDGSWTEWGGNPDSPVATGA
ncbi:3-mercaptopyruvate sulfurtransferase [Aestuariivirga litoralis]|uniref:3-mercaptopyruvate sulfurtransferase n=1 Tax=Aestuariivirga litoralis TaxID=2650924 RepID=A0A2W2BTN8_9HYPH|nr:3-mercaptopyruvate sulfurtransferase [Aestuariivirga litoralis]PZF76816.1 3-mercaptopyruvate sulfurtransferase [Aestuariivirga litoralis]